MMHQIIDPEQFKWLDCLNQNLTNELHILQYICEKEELKNHQLMNSQQIPDLEDINQSLLDQLSQQNQLQKQRQSYLKRILKKNSTSPIHLDELIQNLESRNLSFKDKYNIDQIKEHQQQLLKLAEYIKYINTINQTMIEDILKLIEYTFHLYTDESHLTTDYTKPMEKNTKKPILLDTTV